MMTAAIDRSAAENCLVSLFKTISGARISSMSSLRAVPALYSAYIEAFRVWMIHVGFATVSCASVIRTHGATAADMTDDLLVRLLKTERRICRTRGRTEAECIQASLHPGMDAVLEMAVRSGASGAIRYLMRLAQNFCVDKYRSEREMLRNTVSTDVETLRRGESDPQCGSAVKGHPAAAGMDESELMRRETMAAAFGCFGGDFLQDAALLGAALKAPRQALADAIYAGQAYQVACVLVKKVNEELKADYTEAFRDFLKAARCYRLPEKYLADRDALLRCMYRATASSARQEMKKRIVEATA